MSKKPNSTARAQKPVRVSPLIAMYVPSLQPGAAPSVSAPGQPLVSKAAFGVTLNRYRGHCEVIYADGRKVAARGMWGLLFKLLRGVPK